jgi:hypothetical protein
VVISPAEGGLPWPFTFPTGWGSDIFSLGRESVSRQSAARKLDGTLKTDTLATKISRSVTCWLPFLGFRQGLLLTTNATVFVRATRLHLRCGCSVDAAMLLCTWEQFLYHLDICRVTLGAHIEHT